METRKLEKTGIQVSQLGLGCGGNSRLGMAYGQSEDQAAEVVCSALDMGVTLVDTARVYGTEKAVGKGILGKERERIVLSSKSPYLDKEGQLLTAQAFRENVETSLREIGVEQIDIYFIHGLAVEKYEASRDRFLPVLQRAKQEGIIRCFGLTEVFESDPGHSMLQRAVQDAVWDIFMVGYNLINQSARERVLAPAKSKGIATLGMFAVRRGLVSGDLIRVVLRKLEEIGEIEPGLADAPDLMEALGLNGVCDSLSEAAYRFCAYDAGIDAVLSGTGSSEHLRMNIESVRRGPLPAEVIARLGEVFARVQSVSGQVKTG